MNTRGLTEIVVLTIGVRTGILDQQLYSLLVVMALITTAMTGPLLSLIHRNAQRHGVPAQLDDADNTAARSTVRPDRRAVAMSD
jgi:Kef-type K+ transport system membrane component KefB